MAALAAAVCLPLLLALRRAPVDDGRRGAVAIYRDQLTEIDRDVERGLVRPEEATAARNEIARRLIRANAEAGDIQGSDGRWRARSCGERHAFACRSGDGTWSVHAVATPYAAAAGRCAGGSVAVPRYGYEDVQLAAAMRAAGVDDVWLGLTRTGTGWTPADRR